jgi:hypothetical protein
MITVATVYYEGGKNVPYFSQCYSPEWVDKLYRGVARHYSEPFRFVCLTDNNYAFEEKIETKPLHNKRWATACLQLHAVEAERLVIMGLDTVITGRLNEIFAYTGDLAVPRDPYRIHAPCNGVVLCPTRTDIATSSSPDDMRALESFKYDWLDDLFPGQILSYKVHVRPHGLGDARIVYFHGEPKPHVLYDEWIKEFWV